MRLMSTVDVLLLFSVSFRGTPGRMMRLQTVPVHVILSTVGSLEDKHICPLILVFYLHSGNLGVQSELRKLNAA